jgi:CheY-like chemotaxis protein
VTVLKNLSPFDFNIVSAVRNHAEKLLDHSPRFRYFTLHGQAHIENMFVLANLLHDLGLKLTDYESLLLSVAICIHDLGMIVPLKDEDLINICGEYPQLIDPTLVELHIRERHHELVDLYVAQHFDFLTSLGVAPSECGLMKEIAKSHRRTSLNEQSGYGKKIGAILRLIDELDIGPHRAPAALLRNSYIDMDSITCWHWFKNNIVDSWHIDHNVKQAKDGMMNSITFELIVRPPTDKSISYWHRQIIRPISRVLLDEEVARIISENWAIKLRIVPSSASSPNDLGEEWEEIEKKAISQGMKVILVIDDEVRKMEDLFVPLMKDFRVIFANNAKDAFDKISATKIDLAIVDMQIGSGNLWTPEETDNYKATGKKMCEEILKLYPDTKVGILTGTRYELKGLDHLHLSFVIRKPIEPAKFERTIHDILR